MQEHRDASVTKNYMFIKNMAGLFVIRDSLVGSHDSWNNIPHYTQPEKYGRGHCKPSLTSYYAHHS